MGPRLATPLLLAAGLSLVAVPTGVRAAEDAPPDRAKIVRATYGQVPPTVLQFKDPLRVTLVAEQPTPRAAIVLGTEDGDAAIHEFTWWLDKGKSSNREYDRIYWVHYDGAGAQRGTFRLAVRGAEEAALYGLLLRYAATQEKKDALSPVDKSRLSGVMKLLEKFDQRFGGEKPMPQK